MMLPLIAIVAHVGQEAITKQDIDNFSLFLALSLQLDFQKIREEEKSNLKKQALQELRKIAIQLKVAKPFIPKEKELQAALEGLAKQNNVALGDMKQMFVKAKIPWSLFEEKIRAQVAWGHYVHHRFRSLTHAYEEKAPVSSEKEYELHERTFDSQAQALDYHKKLLSLKSLPERRHLILQDTKGKGYWGWLKKSQLPKSFDLKTIGSITQPISMDKGYRIALLSDMREPHYGPLSETSISFVSVTLPKESQNLEYDFLKRQLKGAKTVKEFEAMAQRIQGHVEKMEHTPLFALPFEVVKTLSSVQPGKIISYSTTVNHVPLERYLFVLSKKDPVLTKQEKINWGDRKLSALSEREMNKYLKQFHERREVIS